MRSPSADSGIKSEELCSLKDVTLSLCLKGEWHQRPAVFFLCRGLLVKPHLLSREVGLLSRAVTLPEHILVLMGLVFWLWRKADAYRMGGADNALLVHFFGPMK